MWAIHLARFTLERLDRDLTDTAFFVAAVLTSTTVTSLSYQFIEGP